MKALKCHFRFRFFDLLFTCCNEMSSTNSEKSYTTTPLKSEGSSFVARHQLYGRNANPYKTPVRHKVNSTTEINLSKTNSYKSIMIEKMPIYSPPPKNVSFVKNPFEHAKLLKERLSQPVCSPSLFKAVSSPAQKDDFTWSIEDISVLHPADIDENPSQDFDSWFSPATENEAQKAINRFFSSRIVGMESPVVDVKKIECRCGLRETPLTLDTWTQTDLTLPPVLPPEVEAVLSKYCNFKNNQNNDDLDSSNSSTSRKKLLFRNYTCESPEAKVRTVVTSKAEHSIGVSTPITTRLSSPELSPVTESSAMDISIRNKSAVRLNLTNDIEMSEKENVLPKDWNCQGCSTPRANTRSSDSAFSSM